MSMDKLIKSFAAVTERRKAIQGARKDLHGRSTEQLDSMPEAIHTASNYVASDIGGVLGYRRLRGLIQERADLENVRGEIAGRIDHADS